MTDRYRPVLSQGPEKLGYPRRAYSGTADQQPEDHIVANHQMLIDMSIRWQPD